jgi:hypothetical protein
MEAAAQQPGASGLSPTALPPCTTAGRLDGSAPLQQRGGSTTQDSAQETSMQPGEAERAVAGRRRGQPMRPLAALPAVRRFVRRCRVRLLRVIHHKRCRRPTQWLCLCAGGPSPTSEARVAASAQAARSSDTSRLPTVSRSSSPGSMAQLDAEEALPARPAGGGEQEQLRAAAAAAASAAARLAAEHQQQQLQQGSGDAQSKRHQVSQRLTELQSALLLHQQQRQAQILGATFGRHQKQLQQQATHASGKAAQQGGHNAQKGLELLGEAAAASGGSRGSMPAKGAGKVPPSTHRSSTSNVLTCQVRAAVSCGPALPLAWPSVAVEPCARHSLSPHTHTHTHMLVSHHACSSICSNPRTHASPAAQRCARCRCPAALSACRAPTSPPTSSATACA